MCYNAYMAKFVSGVFALKLWQVDGLDEIVSSELYNSGLTEYTVTSVRERYRKKGEKIYLSTVTLPEGAVKKVKGFLVASPELAFLQVANKLHIHELILLGLQMCSHPPGRPKPAISTKEKLFNFAISAVGHAGRRKALQAIQYIQDGSNSIVESKIYLFLRLPYHLGGLSINNIIFNYKVKLDGAHARKLKQHNCFFDFFLPDYNIGIEYDSNKFHGTTSQMNKDADRDSVLSAMGYKVLHLNTYQLFNEKSFELFLEKLIKYMDKRFRIQNLIKYVNMQKSIRHLLLRGVDTKSF